MVRRDGKASTISVVMVSFRTGAVLRESLAASRDRPEVAELIIIDNGNPPKDSIWLTNYCSGDPTARLIRPGRNIGFAAACNRGVEIADGDYVAFVNPDAIVPPGTFAAILDAFARNPDVWLCGGRLLNMDGVEQRGGRREVLTPWRCLVEVLRLDRLAPAHPYFRRLHLLDDGPVAGVTAVPVVSGAFMVMPREKFIALGGMDETMFLHVEDVDLCVRVLLAGGQVAYCGDAPVYHRLSTSDVSRCFVEWHKTRSTIRYFFKHFQGVYPKWSLTAIGVILWLRFAAVVLRHVPADALHLMRGGASG